MHYHPITLRHRIIALLLALAMLCTVLPFAVLADEFDEGQESSGQVSEEETEEEESEEEESEEEESEEEESEEEESEEGESEEGESEEEQSEEGESEEGESEEGEPEEEESEEEESEEEESEEEESEEEESEEEESEEEESEEEESEEEESEEEESEEEESEEEESEDETSSASSSRSMVSFSMPMTASVEVTDVNCTITDSTGTATSPSNALVEAIANIPTDRIETTTITLPAGYFNVPTEITQSVTIVGVGSTRLGSSSVTTLYFAEPLAVKTDNVSLSIQAVDIDVDVTDGAFVNGNGVIELGNTSTATVNSNISLTIKDSYMLEKGIVGTELGTAYVSAAVYIVAQQSPSITIDNSYLLGRYTLCVSSYSGTNGYGYSHNTKNAIYTITNSTLKGWTTGNMRGEDTDYTATDSTFIGENAYSGSSNTYSTFVMTDGSIDGSYTFTNCTITASNTGDQGQNCFSFQYGATDNVLCLTNCTFEMTTANGVQTGIVSAGENVSDYPDTLGNDVVINNVTYEDISNNNGDGQLYVVVGNELQILGLVAKIGDVQYDNIGDAIEAADSGQTVVLCADTTHVTQASQGIKVDADITVDLAGYTFTTEGGVTDISIASGASLTFTDSSADQTGSVVVAEGSTCGISNSGTLIIDCNMINEAIINNAYYTWSDIYITDDGVLTNDGAITNNYYNYIWIENGGVLINQGTFWNNGYTEVSDGGVLNNTASITNAKYLYVVDGGTLINASNFENTNYTAISSGGTFTNSGTLSNSAWFGIYEGSTITSTGTVNNTCVFEYDYIPTVDISNSVAYGGYWWDGVYYYEYYPTLAAAIADVDAGDTVYLVQDTTITNTIDLAQDITIISTNGATITMASDSIPLFTISEDVDVTFDSIGLSGGDTGISVQDTGSNASVTITGCTFSDMDVAISATESSATGSWSITGNSFTDVSYAFDLSTANDYNDDYSLAYNYFGGELPVILDSSDDSTYDNTANENDLVLYPYYADAALTVLVYAPSADGTSETKTVIEAASDAVASIDISSTNSDVLEVAEVIALLNSEAVAADADLVEAINTFEEAFLAVVEDDSGSGEIEVEGSTPTIPDTIEETDAMPTEQEIIPEGLAVAVFGSSLPAEDTTVTLSLDVDQIEAEDESVAFAFTAVPYQTVTKDGDDTGTTSVIANSSINSPVTFNVYLPESFTAEYAKVVHYKTGGGSETFTLPVLTDASGARYIRITVTGFSTFTVAEYTPTVADTSTPSITTTTTSSKKYYTISLSYEGEGTITPDGSEWGGKVYLSSSSMVTFVFTPSVGYQVTDVLVNGESVGAVGYYTVAYPTDHQTVHVVFGVSGHTNPQTGLSTSTAQAGIAITLYAERKKRFIVVDCPAQDEE